MRKQLTFHKVASSLEPSQNNIKNSNQSEALPRSGYETPHQYGISVLVTQMSFCEGLSGDLVKCRLFSQAKKMLIKH